MPLNLYRRHSRSAGKCAAGLPPDFRNYETDELRRGWKKCHCPIYADGILAGQFRRKNTKQTAWSDARHVATNWETLGRWDRLLVPPPPPVPVPAEEPQGVTVERAVSAFIQEHTASSAPNTVKKYRLIMRQLTKYAEIKGYRLIEQFRPIDIREFRQSWGVSPLTASKHLGILKAFFEYALVNEWIDKNPARLVRTPRGQSGERSQRNRERVPFSDDELKRMFHACHVAYAKQAAYRYEWTGEDLEDFIAVSIYTGLRISDVSTFHIDRLKPSGECHIRTTKNGNKVFTWVPEWLQQRIRARAQKYGPLIFGEHTTTDLNVVTDLWRRKLKRLWALCGPWKDAPMPHRFRHTFARILLERSGVTVRDVAELLGDTEDMIRRHYASWVPERQERLTAVLKEAFREKPMPKVVALR